ncbi:MAG: hypothetical protein WC790_00425 [Candidatus Paceibacterota bacterium]|jgi:hypothetical protein
MPDLFDDESYFTPPGQIAPAGPDSYLTLPGAPVSNVSEVMKNARTGPLPPSAPASPLATIPGQASAPAPKFQGRLSGLVETPGVTYANKLPALPVRVAEQPRISPLARTGLEPLPDNRPFMRQIANAMILKGTTAQRLQGLQMLADSDAPTDDEKAARTETAKLAKEQAERDRLNAELDTLDLPQETAKRGRFLINTGAKTNELYGALGFDAPGTANDLKRREGVAQRLHKFATDARDLGTLRTNADLAIAYIDKGLASTGTIAKGLTELPYVNLLSTDASRLARALDPIKSILGFDRLNEMREESKTGGALGNVTVQEIKFLQATQGSLDIGQDKEVLKSNIRQVVKGREILNQMRRLVPAIEKGDEAAMDAYVTLSTTLGELGSVIGNRRDEIGVPPEPESSYESLYGGPHADGQ